MKTLISFRLRKDLDADLIAMEVDENKLNDMCRDGLRLLLGIRTAKHMEVRERPIVSPRIQEQERAVQLLSKPAVFIPKKG